MPRFVFKFPDGTVRNLDDFPDPDTIDPKFRSGKWVSEGINSVEMEVFHLEFPPVKITFRTDQGDIIYDSDKIPEEQDLPSINEKEGMRGSWKIPKNPVTDVMLEPIYTPVEYTITFNDCMGSRKVRFSIKRPPKFPEVRPKFGCVGWWSTNDYELHDMVIEAVYETVRIIFTYDGKTDIQNYFDYKLPDLESKQGYIRKWEVPDNPGNKDILLSPIEVPIEYSLTVRMNGEVLTTTFTLSDSPKMPEIPYKVGYVGYWTEFDHTIPKDQETTLVYRPVRVLFHCPNGSTVESSYVDGEEIVPPDFEGYAWPEFKITNTDLELSAKPKICFALFYVDKKLRFCVPYTVTDRHYLHEMFRLRTVPKLHRRCGRWCRQENSQDGLSIYVADYSNIQPDLPRERTSISWGLDEISDHIYDHGSIIELDGSEVDLFDTDFSKYTGITKKNLESLITLPFLEWLRREKIHYLDRVEGYTIQELKNGYRMKIDGGFWIGYDKEFDKAIEYLQEFDIYFKEPIKKRRKVSGKPAWYLVMSVPFDDLEDEGEVWADLFPISKMIQSMNTVNTEYSVLKEEVKLISLTEEDMKVIVESNQTVIEVFNVTVHPECEFTILDDGLSVRLDKYKGADSEYEIPSKIKFNFDDSVTYPVKEIGERAFSGHSKLKEIMIPDSIEVIGDSAFEFCGSLEKILGGNNIRSVGKNAFHGCSSMKESENVNSIDSEEDPDKNSHSDRDFESSEVREFLASLSECEFDFLDALCRGKDTEPVLALHKKRHQMIVLAINEKATDHLDCDELIDDDNINEDYIDELKAELGE